MFEITISTAERATTVLAIRGAVDAYLAPRVRQALGALGPVERLVIDARGVTFLDSAGLSAIVDGVRRAHSFGTTVALGGTSDRLQKLLEMVGLDRLLPIHRDVHDAIAAVAATEEEVVSGVGA